MSEQLQHTCLNCGYPLHGKFCSKCGEQVYTSHDKSFSHLLEEVFHFLTHLDNKFFKSLRLLFLKPGFISFEFCRGIRKKYFKPVSLFLVGIVIYLLFPLTQGLNLSFNSNIDTFKSVHINVLQQAAEHKAASHHLSLNELEKKYDEKSPKVAKIMLFILLPLAGLILLLMFKKKQRFYFDHFILGTELSTFFVYFSFLLLPLCLNVIVQLLEWFSGKKYLHYGDWFIGPVMILIIVPIWASALRRFYAINTFRSYVASLLFLLLFVVLCTFFIYRFILFFTILLFI